jgi:putative flippase GtrA
MPFGEMFRFGVASSLNVLITFIFYALLVTHGTLYSIANLMAWILGIFCSYFLNLIYVFKNGKKAPAAGQFSKFFILYGFSFLLSTGALIGLVKNDFAGPIVSQFIVIPIVALFNYTASRFLVFKSNKSI